MANVSEWSVNSGSNTSAAPHGAPEGMAPSSVNDTMRENMAAVARWYQDTNGSLTSGGTGNSFVLTTNNGHASLSDLSLLVFKANHANTGAATLNTDSTGAKSLRIRGSALVGGEIVEDQVLIVAYNSTDDAYDILGPPTANTSGSFTPTITAETVGDLSVSYSAQTGQYWLHNDICFFQLSVIFTPTYSSADDNFRIAGLPFAHATSPAGGSLAHVIVVETGVGAAFSWPTGSTQLNALVGQGTSFATIVGVGNSLSDSATIEISDFSSGDLFTIIIHGFYPI